MTRDWCDMTQSSWTWSSILTTDQKSNQTMMMMMMLPVTIRLVQLFLFVLLRRLDDNLQVLILEDEWDL